MKRKTLLAMAVALLCSVGSWAQTWTGNAVGAGTFYLYNVGAGKFLNIGNKSNDSWGTNANLSANSTFDFTLANVSDGVYTIDSKVSNGGNNHYVNSSTWCDGAATNWTFRAVAGETNVYQIIFNGEYLMATTELDDVEMLGDPGSRTTSTYWKLVTKADRIAALTSATEDSPLDATFLITAPNFGRNDTRNSVWQGSPSIGGADNTASCNFNAEKFNTTFDVYQTISDVPNGWYKLYVQGYYRDGGYVAAASAYNAGTENLYAKYYINSVSAPLMSIFDDSGKTGNSNQTTAGITGKFPNDRAGEMSAFNAGLYENIPLIVNVTDGNIRVGVKAETLTGDAWTGFDNFRLEYLGTTEPQVQSYVKMKNPQPFVHGTGWTLSSDLNEADAANRCSGFWNKTATMTQEIPNLPAGYYLLTAVAFQRDGGDGTVSLNDQSVVLPGCGSVNNRNEANTFFNEGNGVNNITYHLINDGSITVGLQTNSKGDHWTIYRSFELKYLGEYPISVTQQFLADAVTEAEGLYASLPTAAKATLKAVVDAKNISYSTGKEYSDAADDVIAAISTARPIMEPYARFLAVKPNVVALKSQTTKYTDPGTAVTTFDAAVAAQQTAVDEATTAAAVETAIVNLRKAASAFAGNVDIVAGQYLDLTDAMLYNASMRNSGDLSLWTIVSNTNPSYPKYANNCSEFWQANFDFYQTAYELPAGNYNIEVSAFHRAAQAGSTYHTFLYANSDQVLVLPLANGENNTAQAETSFNAGLYVNSIKITLDDATNVNIGFKNEDTADDKRENGSATDKWTIFRDFKIKYFGDDALALYRDEYEEALNAAEDALDNATYTNVGGTDRSNLSTAVTTTYPKSVVEDDETQEKFETATENLTTLTTTFKNGVANWNTYTNTRAAVATAKAEADLIDEGIYAGVGITAPTTAAEAAAKAASDEPAVRVATAQYVAANYTFSLTSKIGDFSTWTGTALDAEHGDTPVDPQTLNSEHWSNTTRTYYEQSARGWYSENWSVTYTKVANNLPAGNYVLKLAARGSVDTHGTIASSATANTVTLPTAGNNTRGITTSGVASWADGDTFRKSAGAATEDNKGAGWQWRFLPFTVGEAGDVTLTINVSSDMKWNWVSLADAELLSDEDKTTKITLSDASDMASTITSNDGELATVTLQRGIKEGYNTVVLPFDLTAVQVQAVFGTGAVVYSYSENSANVNSAELTFTTVGSGAITANVPVLVKATAAATEKVIEGVTIEAPTSTIAEGTNFDYVGVYDLTTFADGDYFIATKAGVQQIFRSNGTDSAKPFRAYFQKKSGGDVKANLFIDGVATRISDVNSVADEEENVFNLAGQRLNKAQKGVNIINGKKILVK